MMTERCHGTKTYSRTQGSWKTTNAAVFRVLFEMKYNLLAPVVGSTA